MDLGNPTEHAVMWSQFNATTVSVKLVFTCFLSYFLRKKSIFQINPKNRDMHIFKGPKWSKIITYQYKHLFLVKFYYFGPYISISAKKCQNIIPTGQFTLPQNLNWLIFWTLHCLKSWNYSFWVGGCWLMTHF